MMKVEKQVIGVKMMMSLELPVLSTSEKSNTHDDPAVCDNKTGPYSFTSKLQSQDLHNHDKSSTLIIHLTSLVKQLYFLNLQILHLLHQLARLAKKPEDGNYFSFGCMLCHLK